MAAAEKSNGWSEWQNHVLCELQRLSTSIDNLSTIIHDNSKELAALKVKAGIWGAIAGMIPSIGVLLWFLLAQGQL